MRCKLSFRKDLNDYDDLNVVTFIGEFQLATICCLCYLSVYKIALLIEGLNSEVNV